MKADWGLTIERMVELGGVSRAGFYRFYEDGAVGPDPDMDLRDAIHRAGVAQLRPAADYGRAPAAGLESESQTGVPLAVHTEAKVQGDH